MSSGLGQPVLRAGAVDGRERRGLAEVVEDDEHVGQVEERQRQADGVGLGHRQLLPARGGLVGEVAHARGQRDRQLAVRRRLRQQPAQRLERVGRGEAVDLGVVVAAHDGLVALDREDAAAHADHRVAAVAGAALDRLEDEGEAVLVVQPQGGGDRRDGVGADLDGGHAGETGARELGGHGSVLGYLRIGALAGVLVEEVDGFEIPAPAVAHDAVADDRLDDRDMAPRLARHDVADVDLHDRALGAQQRVVERPGVVGQGAGVDDDGVVVALLDAVDERALVVRLQAASAWPRLAGMVGGRALHLGQRGRAVDLRLALAEAAQVGAVEQQVLMRVASAADGARWPASSSASVTSSTSMTVPDGHGQDPALPARDALLVAAQRGASRRRRRTRAGARSRGRRRRSSMRSARPGSAPRRRGDVRPPRAGRARRPCRAAAGSRSRSRGRGRACGRG